MSNPQYPAPGAGQHNTQYNQASHGGSIYANQGGTQSIHHHTNNNFTAASRSWAGWAVMVILVVDVAFFFYGQQAYTGHANDSGDMWRAGIFFFLLAVTGSLIRRWLRRRF